MSHFQNISWQILISKLGPFHGPSIKYKVKVTYCRVEVYIRTLTTFPSSRVEVYIRTLTNFRSSMCPSSTPINEKSPQNQYPWPLKFSIFAVANFLSRLICTRGPSFPSYRFMCHVCISQTIARWKRHYKQQWYAYWLPYPWKPITNLTIGPNWIITPFPSH
jgi:hypothetical protein